MSLPFTYMWKIQMHRKHLACKYDFSKMDVYIYSYHITSLKAQNKYSQSKPDFKISQSNN